MCSPYTGTDGDPDGDPDPDEHLDSHGESNTHTHRTDCNADIGAQCLLPM